MRLPKLINFAFTNGAGSFDVEGNEYSDFEGYFSQIKANRRFAHTISWGTKIYTFLDVQVSVNPMGMQVYPQNASYTGGLNDNTGLGMAGTYPRNPY